MSFISQINSTYWLANIARSMVPNTVAVAHTDPRLTWNNLHPEEAPALVKMVASRRREYAAGRAAAHAALGQISVFNAPVISGHDRAPIWPENTIGSISHTNSVCLALAAHKRDVRSIGVDVEPYEALEQGLIANICNSEEMQWLDKQPASHRNHLAKIIFSAKECIYKCQYPLTKQMLTFHAVHIQINKSAGTFCATFKHASGVFHTGYTLQGRFFTGQGLILTTAILLNDAQTASLQNKEN